MFRDLMNWAFKQVDVTPNFATQHCLAVRGGSCRACAEVCPHDAITITRTVTIEPVDCTGCGLCVSVCPSFALTPRERVLTDHAVRCSQVSGESTSVVCLARLQASDIVRMAAPGRPLTLARADCGTCDIGGPAVPEAVDRAVAEARELLALHGRGLELEVVEVDHFDVPRDRLEISRRDLLRGGWKELRRSSGALLAPLEGFAEPDEATVDRRALPVEHQRRIRAIELAEPEATTPVPLALPEVLDGCILCPACTRACPTNALRRVFDGDAAGGARLELENDRCIGCDACVGACPVGVVRMRNDVTWGEYTGPPRIVYRADRPAAPLGSVVRTSAPAPLAGANALADASALADANALADARDADGADAQGPAVADDADESTS
jgi:ferredoxin